jgi:alpha-tubulin suppressor-like RCC1 family protein
VLAIKKKSRRGEMGANQCTQLDDTEDNDEVLRKKKKKKKEKKVVQHVHHQHTVIIKCDNELTTAMTMMARSYAQGQRDTKKEHPMQTTQSCHW